MAEQTKPYSPDNPAHVRSRKRQAEHEAELEKEAIRWVLSDARGRLVLSAIIGEAGFYQNPFRPESSEATAYECGRLSVATGLRNTLEEKFPEALLAMETERLKAKIDAKVKDEAARTQARQEQTDQED
jgi:hypothetical protein